MRIGLDAYTIEHRHLTVEQTLAFARDHRLDGVQFVGPRTVSPGLEPGRLTEVRELARSSDLALEVGISSLNPARRSKIEGTTIGAEEHARDLIREVEAVHLLGCRHARVYLGDRHDRFRTDVAWAVQLDASRSVLERMVSALRDLDVTLAVETHADATTNELVALLDAFPPEVLGVTIDTGNLAMRLDHPLEAVERLAPRVRATHVKDAVLAFTPRGLCWQARPVGSGIMPMPDLLAILYRANPALMLSIELHPRTYDLPIFEPAWLSYFPDLRPRSLAAVVRLAVACERRFAEGSLARPEVVETIPWPDRDLDWLASSLGYLRAIVSMLGRMDSGGED